MSLPKLFNRIFWHNNTTPAINEDNLNAMSKAIDDIDNRVIELNDDVVVKIPQIEAYLEQAEDLVEAMELLSQNPPYIGANGNWFVWNTQTSSFVDSGVDASITVDIADVTMLAEGSSPYITNTGTDTDPVFHLFIPIGATGAAGVSPGVTITTIAGGHRVTITDKDHPSGQSFDVLDGSGSGDMKASVYDPNSEVASAGGIKAFIQSLGYITGLAWSALTNKPFSTIGNGLTVTSDTLSADVKSVSVDHNGTASASATSKQRVEVNGTYYDVDGSKYMEYSQTLSTSADTVYTFSNADILTTSAIDVYTDIWGVNPSDVSASSGVCMVTFPKQTTAQTMTCRIYIK